MTVIERLGRNLQFSAYAQAVAILSSLLLTPFILRRVDLGLYGLNALIVSIVGYFNLLDLGLSSGIARFAATFFGAGEKERIQDILRLGIKFFACLGTLVGILLFLLSFFYERLFHIQPELMDKGRLLLLIYAAASLFIWINIPFREILSGLQRMDIIYKVGLVISILNIPLALVVLTYAKSYLLYVALFQLITVLFSCANIVSALKLVPNFRFSLAPIAKTLKVQLIRFSGWYFLAGIFGLIIFQVDYLVIGIFLDVNAVAIYSIAFVIHNYIRSLNSLLGSPLYFALTSEFARRNETERNTMIINATRMHSGILIPVVIIAMVGIDNFILSWVGRRFTGAILPCRILLSYWFFNITREILSHGVVGGKGRVVESVKLESFVAAANLVLSLWLVRLLGITGVALGTAIPWILASGFYVFRFCQILSIAASDFVRGAILPNLVHFSVALLLTVFARGLMDSTNVFVILTIMVVIYAISLLTGYILLSTENKRIIKKILILRS